LTNWRFQHDTVGKDRCKVSTKKGEKGQFPGFVRGEVRGGGLKTGVNEEIGKKS